MFWDCLAALCVLSACCFVTNVCVCWLVWLDGCLFAFDCLRWLFVCCCLRDLLVWFGVLVYGCLLLLFLI